MKKIMAINVNVIVKKFLTDIDVWIHSVRMSYFGTILDIIDFLLAEGDDVNLEMQEILEESNIRTEHLHKGLIK